MSQVKLQAAYYHKPDKRLRTTQTKLFAALRQAFEHQQNFDDIRVSALCQSAGIARQTFYRHYTTIGEIIELNIAWVANDFLKQTDQIHDSTRYAPRLMVDLIDQNRASFAMIFWSHTEQPVTEYLIRDMRRVNIIRSTNTPETIFAIELYARMLINFAQSMITHSELSRDEFIKLYQALIPAPETIFHEK
jgi:AcrR family transcriptional regulator